MKSNQFAGKIPANKLARFRKIGFYFLLLDYLFIGYIIFRADSIGYIFKYELEGFYRKRMRFAYRYAYTIPTLQVPSLLMLFILFRTVTDSFRKKAIIKKNTRMLTFRHYVVNSLIVFAFSGLFLSTIKQYIAYLPEDIQDKAVPAYYLSYIIMILYFFVRTFFTFDYYQALYLKDKTDYRLIFAFGLMIFLAFTIHKLPYWSFF